MFSSEKRWTNVCIRIVNNISLSILTITNNLFHNIQLFNLYFRKDKLVYLWDMNQLNKPVNKITFIDPLISLSYNPCVFTVRLNILNIITYNL